MNKTPALKMLNKVKNQLSIIASKLLTRKLVVGKNLAGEKFDTFENWLLLLPQVISSNNCKNCPKYIIAHR